MITKGYTNTTQIVQDWLDHYHQMGGTAKVREFDLPLGQKVIVIAVVPALMPVVVGQQQFAYQGIGSKSERSTTELAMMLLQKRYDEEYCQKIMGYGYRQCGNTVVTEGVCSCQK